MAASPCQKAMSSWHCGQERSLLEKAQQLQGPAPQVPDSGLLIQAFSCNYSRESSADGPSFMNGKTEAQRLDWAPRAGAYSQPGQQSLIRPLPTIKLQDGSEINGSMLGSGVPTGTSPSPNSRLTCGHITLQSPPAWGPPGTRCLDSISSVPQIALGVGAPLMPMNQVGKLK